MQFVRALCCEHRWLRWDGDENRFDGPRKWTPTTSKLTDADNALRGQLVGEVVRDRADFRIREHLHVGDRLVEVDPGLPQRATVENNKAELLRGFSQNLQRPFCCSVQIFAGSFSLHCTPAIGKQKQ